MCLRVAVVAAGRVKMNRSTVNYHEQTRREQRKKRNPSRCRAKIFTPKNSGNDISGNCAECWRITNPSCARAERAPLRLVFTGRNTPRRPVMRSGGKFIVIFVIFFVSLLFAGLHTHTTERSSSFSLDRQRLWCHQQRELQEAVTLSAAGAFPRRRRQSAGNSASPRTAGASTTRCCNRPALIYLFMP